MVLNFNYGDSEIILLDNNQIIIASVFQSIKYNDNIDENFLRHLVLNTYRMYRSRFKNKYGELIICNDSSNYWRKEIFPLYKANRKRDMNRSKVDWTSVFSAMDVIRNEIKENFPYKNIRVDRTEADDIIAILCQEYHEKENIVIISNDKDFQQLQVLPNVEQYSPTKKKFLVCENPEEFLLNHIIKGDSSDGIPNILSDDDVFMVENKRQTPCGVKKMSQIVESIEEWKEKDNWKRNKKLIDMNEIPEEYKEKIINVFETSVDTNRSNLLNYFIENKLKNLMANIGDF